MHLDVLSKKFLNFDNLKRFKIRPFDVFINIFGILKEIIELFCFCKTNIAQLFIIIWYFIFSYKNPLKKLKNILIFRLQWWFYFFKGLYENNKNVFNTNIGILTFVSDIKKNGGILKLLTNKVRVDFIEYKKQKWIRFKETELHVYLILLV